MKPTVWAALGTTALTACTPVETVEELGNPAFAFPKLAYTTSKVPSGPEPVLSVAAIQEDDRAVKVLEIDTFGTPGPITKITLAPNEAHLAAIHVEDVGDFLEARALIYTVPKGNQVYFATDNSLEQGFETLCADSNVADPFVEDIPDLIAEDNLPPDTEGVAFTFIDANENQITNLQWLSNDVLLISAQVEFDVTYVGPSEDVSIGGAGSVDVDMELSRSNDGWALSDCSAAGTQVAPNFAKTRDLVLGERAANGQIIELDGAPLIDVDTDAPIAPTGARRLDGPYTTP